MSYEGYTQHICTNGHYYTACEDYCENEERKCPYCEAKNVWTNSVDETNGEDVGHIMKKDLKKYFLIKEKVVKTCFECRKDHILEYDLYKIPSEAETFYLRTADYGDGLEYINVPT